MLDSSRAWSCTRDDSGIHCPGFWRPADRQAQPREAVESQGFRIDSPSPANGTNRRLKRYQITHGATHTQPTRTSRSGGSGRALGLNNPAESRSRRSDRDRSDQTPLKSKPVAGPRMRMVWAVCDMGGRTVATFEYAQKADAEAHIAALKARGKGAHFLRQVKEPMGPGS